MTSENIAPKEKLYLPILRTVSIYALFSTLWIVLSDWFIHQITSNSVILTQLQTYKGTAFVILSSLLIFQLLHLELKKREQSWFRHQKEVNALMTRLRASNQEIAEAYDETIKGWALTLELRDQETLGHSERVVGLTIKIARQMNLTSEELLHIRWGALLHDIGKLGIPDRILLKPSKLNPEERAEINRHPDYAYQMLKPIQYLEPILDIPHYHHEKWDGSGYPGGLKEDEIPLPARIFSIVDVWDAMTSDRPYRDAIPDEEVLQYIAEQSGIHFDPSIVDIFLKIQNQTIEDQNFEMISMH